MTNERLVERIIIPMSVDMIALIDGYRRTGQRIPSRAEAIRELIAAGLRAKANNIASISVTRMAVE